MSDVSDMPMKIIATGTTPSASPAVAIATGQSGRGILVICNDDANAVRLGSSGVGATGLNFPAGARDQYPLDDVGSMFVYGSGAVVSWMVLGQ